MITQRAGREREEAGAVGELGHHDCVALVAAPHHERTALVWVEGWRPLPLACFVSYQGDVLIPTGENPLLADTVCGRAVTVEFLDRGGEWVVRGTGTARPLTREDLPPRVPSAATEPAMLHASRYGIHVHVSRFSGTRSPAAPDSAVLHGGHA
ncbi:hypothetical protein [Prauserella flavalba]|uniref:Pyridoxamine 5'-phosphate oxidase n=1 Tax=Prauserella flavalba TaxID=1477506 RepID=A0A318LQ41_9PSEU|nr:hypothetical protein [Prauserella flavalba]PXY36521.1 hypothetical protein BA062_14125 [Prauserella flavalba]